MSWKWSSIANYSETRQKQPLILKGNDPALLLAEARRIAAEMNCTEHDPALRPCGACARCRQIAAGTFPYWLHIGPRGKSATIQIEQIRELILWMMSKAPDGLQRVAVLEDAHRMNEASQNCLLKTLEEPPDGVQMILLTDEPSRLLPTVASRCLAVGVMAGESLPAETELDLVMDVLAAVQTGGYAGAFEKAAFVAGSRKDRLPDFLEAMAYLLRNKLLAETDAARAATGEALIAALEQVWRAGYLLERNVNTLLILENLFLALRRLGVAQADE